MITQTVARLSRPVLPLREVPPMEAVSHLARRHVEACSENRGKVVPCLYHPFMAAAQAAFMDHRTLVLSPDMFWLLVVQGLAHHVNCKVEELRQLFVRHEGRKLIEIRRDDFVKGSPENPWNEAFEIFSREIGRAIGERNHSNLVAEFSTTGPVEKAAGEVVLMGAMKEYFDYEVHTLCGIPQVTLEGEAADWTKLRDKTETLGAAYDLDWWTSGILPILSAIAKNAAGADDPGLWRDFYKWNAGSGRTFITGWITRFFPYLRDQAGEATRRNWTLESSSKDGITTSNLPGGLTCVPFRWLYLDREFDMAFLAGFTAFTQDETLAVRPKIGWGVGEEGENGGFESPGREG